jgi:hypothetical protein
MHMPRSGQEALFSNLYNHTKQHSEILSIMYCKFLNNAVSNASKDEYIVCGEAERTGEVAPIAYFKVLPWNTFGGGEPPQDNLCLVLSPIYMHTS